MHPKPGIFRRGSVASLRHTEVIQKLGKRRRKKIVERKEPFSKGVANGESPSQGDMVLVLVWFVRGGRNH